MPKSMSPLLLLVVALACAAPLPTMEPLSVSPLRFSQGEWRVVDNVFVISDGSGTMYARETFPESKALARSFVASMPDANAVSARGRGYSAAAIGFGGDAREEAPLAPFDRSRLERTAADFDIMGSIDGMGGLTPLHDVLDEIDASLEGRSGRVAIVLFSDGLADDPPAALASAQRLIEDYAGPVCIHAVQAGDDPEGRAFLRSLTGLTDCGSFRLGANVTTTAQLMDLTRGVFAGERAQLPPVAAADPCAGVIRLRGIEFGFDRAEITPESAVVLDAAADQLARCQNLDVRVDGHTDSTGPESYNLGLSERRAEAARRYLQGEGIASDRITTRGLGESDPIAPNTTPEGRAMNRRVDLFPQR
jgi:outer membrane protein OmpA-like peptidoglycan-associated protein